MEWLQVRYPATFAPEQCTKGPGCLGYMGVFKNNGTPKSSILIGFSIINHPFWGTPIFGNIHMSGMDILLSLILQDY